MKILSKKQQQNALARVSALMITLEETKEIPFEYIPSITENLAEIAYILGGIDGVIKVRATADKYKED